MLNHLDSFYDELSQDGVMLCFLGPTSQSVVEGIGSALKREMELENVGRNRMYRFFSIFVELIQNIARYSIDHGRGNAPDGSHTKYGVVVVGRENGKYFVICGNRVNSDQSESMVERISHLQQLNKQALNALYKQMRREPPAEDSLGAGLGIVEMFRRSSEPVECRVAPLEDNTVFIAIKATS